MRPFWKYTLGLLVEVAVKVLQLFIPKENNVISGTGSQSTTLKTERKK